MGWINLTVGVWCPPPAVRQNLTFLLLFASHKAWNQCGVLPTDLPQKQHDWCQSAGVDSYFLLKCNSLIFAFMNFMNFTLTHCGKFGHFKFGYILIIIVPYFIQAVFIVFYKVCCDCSDNQLLCLLINVSVCVCASCLNWS